MPLQGEARAISLHEKRHGRETSMPSQEKGNGWETRGLGMIEKLSMRKPCHLKRRAMCMIGRSMAVSREGPWTQGRESHFKEDKDILSVEKDLSL
ncbi:unnamed protein product [Linum trigynum]|uniref:Uncharacterized protein n=1 Tax=Linum trigynum TaxID=586398 RepID=A0AAV2EDG0_9ROSI